MRHEDVKDKAKRTIRLAELLLQDSKYTEALELLAEAKALFEASKETDPKGEK